MCFEVGLLKLLSRELGACCPAYADKTVTGAGCVTSTYFISIKLSGKSIFYHFYLKIYCL
jgi:hypothetical protein